MTRRYALPAVLTSREAPEALRTMGVGAAASPAAAAGGAACWRVDASALAEFDSSALAVLLALKRVAAAEHCSLEIDDPPPKLVQLAGLYGLDDVLLGAAIAVREAALAAAPQSAST